MVEDATQRKPVIVAKQRYEAPNLVKVATLPVVTAQSDSVVSGAAIG